MTVLSGVSASQSLKARKVDSMAPPPSGGPLYKATPHAVQYGEAQRASRRSGNSFDGGKARYRTLNNGHCEACSF
jgi:hypothetical protein